MTTTTTKEMTLSRATGKLVALLFWMPAVAIWNGYVFLMLWTWFVVPLGIVQITLPLAIGIDLIVTFLTMSYADLIVMDGFKKQEGGMWSMRFAGLFITGTILLYGWIIQLFL